MMQCFYAAAIVQLVLAAWFISRLQVRRDVLATPAGDRLGRGQRIDCWAAAAVIWTVVAVKEPFMREALAVAALLILAWLARRSILRLDVLRSMP